MPSPFLYSTNPLIKFKIQRDYFGHVHIVWCADCFDARYQHLHAGELVPQTSNPAEIYADVKGATTGNRVDFHNKNIRDWRLSMKDQATKAAAAGGIGPIAEKDIILLLDIAPISEWRPLLYVINRAAVAAKLQEVPPAERANPLAKEYRIANLLPNEFDVLEY